MARTLVVTNDFPPRSGGIQTFVYELVRRFPAGEVVVYASRCRGQREFDAAQRYPVVRDRAALLLPTPRVGRRAAAIARAFDCDSVWFGATAPLGLLATGLRTRTGIAVAVGSTHGHESGWARIPVARTLLASMGSGLDVLTYLGPYTRDGIAPATRDVELVRLAPGVDTDSFSPQVNGAPMRARYGITDKPAVLCLSRLVARKGQDTLIRAMRQIRRAAPGATLLVAGSGPDHARLERLATRCAPTGSVVFAGRVPDAELPALYAACDVFAMPCRSRLGGLDIEGLGIVFLEAAATGKPVVVGRSGGSVDAVRDGETGWLVDGRSVPDVARRVGWLLANPDAAAEFGARGRQWMVADWRWDSLATTLHALLSGQRR